MRMVVGPPADNNWASPWHDILHGWNNKVKMLSDHAGLKPWSVTCIEAVWKFASYVAILFTSRTMDPQDSRMEHERTTATRATGLHLGNSTAKNTRSGKAFTIGLWRLLDVNIGCC